MKCSNTGVSWHDDLTQVDRDLPAADLGLFALRVLPVCVSDGLALVVLTHGHGASVIEADLQQRDQSLRTGWWRRRPRKRRRCAR